MNAMMPGQFRYPSIPHMQFAQHPQQMPVMHDFANQLQSMTSHPPMPIQQASAVARSVKLAAFNIFGSTVREEFQRRKGGNSNGRDVEKWIGQRWREMNQNERQRYVELAQQELARRGGAMTSNKKRKKTVGDGTKRRRGAKRKDLSEDHLVNSTLDGEVEDVFDGGLFVNVTVGGHTPMKAVLFHPKLANVKVRLY